MHLAPSLYLFVTRLFVLLLFLTSFGSSFHWKRCSLAMKLFIRVFPVRELIWDFSVFLSRLLFIDEMSWHMRWSMYAGQWSIGLLRLVSLFRDSQKDWTCVYSHRCISCSSAHWDEFRFISEKNQLGVNHEWTSIDWSRSMLVRHCGYVCTEEMSTRDCLPIDHCLH